MGRGYRQNFISKFVGSKDRPSRTSQPTPSASLELKLVAVGDGGCGKTSLLFRFTRDEFFTEYIPTVFETYLQEMSVDGQPVNLALWDTAGQEAYDRLRPLSYPGTDVVLICYDIESHDSLTNVQETWAAEIAQYCPGKPVLLVGCKADLATPERAAAAAKAGAPHVSSADARQVQEQVGAKLHLACSSKTNLNVSEVFEAAVRLVLQQQRDSAADAGSFRNCCRVL